jgi:hypothetical protein
MSLSKVLLLAIVCLAFLTLLATAQEAPATPSDESPSVESDDNQVPTEDTQTQQDAETVSGFISSPDCEPSYALPNNADKKFELGKPADILLGFSNSGLRPFRVQYIRGHLVSPLDLTYFVQNFTGYYYNVTVNPDETATLLYRFRPDIMLDAREFVAFVDVYYINDQNDTFATTFFNETITLVEPAETFDARSIFAYVSMFGVLALIIFGAFKFVSGKVTKGSKSTKSTVDTTFQTDNKTVDDSFVPAHVRSFSKSKNKVPTKVE